MGRTLSKKELYAAFVVVVTLMELCSCNVKDQTYTHTFDDGTSGPCLMCKPGMRFVAHCTKFKPNDTNLALCVECPEGEYSPNYNLARKCQPCKTHCRDNNDDDEARQEVAKQCTKIADLVCKCVDGFFREPGAYGVCKRWSECPIGKGVKKPGDGHNNTTCEVCMPGVSFSNESSLTEPCQLCSTCEAGEEVASNCTTKVDTSCVKKETQKTDDDRSFKLWWVVPLAVVVVIAIVIAIVLYAMRTENGRKRLRWIFCCGSCRGSTDTEAGEVMYDPSSPNGKPREHDPLMMQQPNGETRNGNIGNGGPVGNGTAHPAGNGHVTDGVQRQHSSSGTRDPMLEMFRRLSGEFVIDFQMLFRCLNIVETDIARVLRDYNAHGVKEQIYQLFFLYYTHNGSSAEHFPFSDFKIAFNEFAGNDFDLRNRCCAIISEYEDSSRSESSS